MLEILFYIAVAFGLGSVGLVWYEVMEMREQVNKKKATTLLVPYTPTINSEYPPIECKTLVFKIGV